jgi:chromosome segregation ATPase
MVRPIYRRRLTDFEGKFHSVHEQIVDLTSRIRALSLDVAAIRVSKDKADAQATLLEDFRSQLNEDLAKVKFELDELTKYGESVSARLGEVRGELSQLYRSNKALSRELAALNAQMTEEIEQRTRSATARAQ